MAMLTHCFFCKKEIIVLSGEKTYKLTDYDFGDLKVFDKYKKESPYALIGKFCCELCFNRELLPKLFL